jgi:hypothetical protein
VKHKTHFIQDTCSYRKVAWIKAQLSQLESEAMLDSSGLPHGIRRHLHGIITKLKSAISVPTGYEDETGFHVGEPPSNDCDR